MNTQLAATIEHYEAAIKRLKEAGSSINAETILRVLNARDAVQAALKQQTFIPASNLIKLIELDGAFRDSAKVITKAINDKTAEQLAYWRESVQPNAEAWWWRLDAVAPHPWDVWDWLWKALTIAGWTANISLLVNIATRFLGGGVGLIGAAAVVLPSILALLQVSSELTKTGQEGLKKLLDNRIPQQYHQEVKLAYTLLMSGVLAVFWLSLPAISNIYNHNGLKNYDNKSLGKAEQDYQRAISLNADNTEAHYNLGNLYEDWQNWEKAKKEYQIAVAGELPEAYNNLARLYIREKKYPQAAFLLTKGLELTNTPDFKKLEVRYSLFKNLGWARLEQGRYEEAQRNLQAAIGITNNPEAIVQKHIDNLGAAHCLLAQVLQKQKQPTALSHWQKCSDLGSSRNPDEDTWLHLGKVQLRKGGK
ncbi:tetratricopeptide repeat protein [Aetokthonos hydrillicola Thurmond2011]|jgi:tetratricopeptide (TPR) repeat protein|uniref:Tetratricopeptide repeat protein n=1 Tax=Aetokthonos hydrillicola Thurmond2011 TaxID=2712845 RepID=A0AAP5IC77_9CYAN|nr:tetratricopeptide repeat protein [Aetokthonos hydrillicola]MBO3462124.1 tetratricopeptide repeat protein [Aetokthonos hydrillicola CCALA 1050]MBW4589718.1 tetratricopeptide repeat protein [Aetokthonos hydrillicola CCALA 1050]MDR9898972.1 tetratricopeptide repeat protein [Aetokthonos hydrillicola Thurmond2011]